MRYNGTLITISHDRHFLNSVCTHIADIDYETIITYNGGYDDMVEQKTAIRTRIESQNEQREKKIAQLNDFIARFSAGTRSSQVNSRKKEVERLATTELARSNIQRPYIRFEQQRPSGRHVLEFEDVNKAYEQKDGTPLQVINKLLRLLHARRQDRPDGPQRARARPRCSRRCWPTPTASKRPTSPSTPATSSGATRPRSATSRRTSSALHPAGHDRQRLAAPVRRGRHQGRHPRHPRPDALQRRRGPEDDRRPLRRRGGAAALLQAHAAEAQRPGPRRALEPP